MSNEYKQKSIKSEVQRKKRRKTLTKIFVWVMLFAIVASVLIGAGFAIFNLLAP